MKIVFTCVVLLIMLSAQSQTLDSLKKLYVNETVYRYGKGFQKGTERLTFRDLQYEFSFSPVGEDSYYLAKKNKTTSVVLQILSLGVAISTSMIAAKNTNVNTLLIGLGAQFALSIAGTHYQNLSTQQLDRAIWQRNKDLLFSAK